MRSDGLLEDWSDGLFTVLLVLSHCQSLITQRQQQLQEEEEEMYNVLGHIGFLQIERKVTEKSLKKLVNFTFFS